MLRPGVFISECWRMKLDPGQVWPASHLMSSLVIKSRNINSCNNIFHLFIHVLIINLAKIRYLQSAIKWTITIKKSLLIWINKYFRKIFIRWLNMVDAGVMLMFSSWSDRLFSGGQSPSQPHLSYHHLQTSDTATIALIRWTLADSPSSDQRIINHSTNHLFYVSWNSTFSPWVMYSQTGKNYPLLRPRFRGICFWEKLLWRCIFWPLDVAHFNILWRLAPTDPILDPRPLIRAFTSWILFRECVVTIGNLTEIF